MKKIALLLVLLTIGMQALFAQSKKVTGVVTSKDDGMPLPGVSVVIKGTTTGASTDIDGNFTLMASPNDLLVVTFVGMVTQEIKVGPKSNFKIILEADTKQIDEVVVTAYGTAKKSSLTGSIAKVDGEKIERKNVSEVTKALAGEVAGVQVLNTSGQPGSNAKIRIRGYGSVNASSAPLYIVDGIPYNGDISSISPSDIASTSVLKDASATAIYGARGANGVVLITTKQGKKGKNNIEVEFTSGINMRLLPDYDVNNSPEKYVEMSWEALRNEELANAVPEGTKFVDYWTDANLKIAGESANTRLFKTGDGFTARYNMWNAAGNELIDPVTGKFKAGVNRKYTPGSWEDAIFSKGKRNQGTVKFTGGSDKITYFSSIGFLNDEGYYINSDFKRINARLNLKYQPKKWLKATTGFSYSYMETNSPGQTDNANNGFNFVTTIPSIYPVYQRNADGSIMIDEKIGGKKYDFGKNVGDNENDGRRYLGGINPAGAVRLDIDNNISHEITFNQLFEAKLYKGLTFQTRFGVQALVSDDSQLTNPYYGDAEGTGRVYKYSNKYLSYTWNQILRYQTSFGDGHNVNGFVAHESSLYERKYLYASNNILLKPDLAELSNGIKMSGMNSYILDYSLESYFAQLNYDFNEQYFIYGTVRRDGTSKFPNDKWGTFGSLGLAWIVSKESFMSDISYVDFLKLKASYGILGNQNGMGYYPTYTTYSVNNLDDKISLKPNATKNPNLTWEKSKTFNVGAEFSLLGKVDVEVDYFIKHTDNLLFSKRISPSSGDALMEVNDGKLLNSGIEFNITYKAIKTDDFSMRVNLNGAHYKNEMLEMPIETATGKPKVLDLQGRFAYSEGHSLYDFYIREWAGVNSETGEGQWYAYSYKDKDDKKQYVLSLEEYLSKDGNSMSDLTKEKVTDYTKATKSFVGKSAIPDIAGSLGLEFDYKGFSLSAQFMYSLGGYSYDASYASLMANGNTGNSNWHVDMDNRWRKPGDKTDVPRLSNDLDKNVSSTSTRFLIKNNYISLNNVRLSYKLPSNLLSLAKLDDASVWISGDNLWLSTKRKGYIPMTSASGTSDSYAYKPLSTVTVGLKVKF